MQHLSLGNLAVITTDIISEWPVVNLVANQSTRWVIDGLELWTPNHVDRQRPFLSVRLSGTTMFHVSFTDHLHRFGALLISL
ncbi:hypothetical protein M8J76_008266 [Diaphorina citri]|nr:hypothetical protein M8J76_008266 [Diaphorina citri]